MCFARVDADTPLSIPPDTIQPPDLANAMTKLVPGSLPGSSSVSPDGEARYSVPLWVPPGRRGMQPSLSLQYHSRGGNGPEGVGWSLVGLSQINRCPHTMAFDSAAAPIKFDVTDAYCMDGQRLRRAMDPPQTSGSVKWGFRTERDTFEEIVATMDVNKGPTHFTVYEKGGLIRDYDGFHTFNGATVSWLVTQVQDRYGNTINISYNDLNGYLYVAATQGPMAEGHKAIHRERGARSMSGPDAKSVLASVKTAVKPMGWTAKGTSFRRCTDEGNTLVVQVQRSRDPGPTKFVVNYGVHSARIARWLQEERPADDVTGAHWRKRVADAGREHWIVLSPGRTEQDVAVELIGCAERAIADLEAHASDAALRDEWLGGRSPGATEFQRLLYLVVLTKELGPPDRLAEALTNLREHVEGTPQAGLVRHYLGALWQP